MLMETTFALTTLVLACGGDYDDPRYEAQDVLPSGPNLKTASPTVVEPYEVVVPKQVGWSPDASLAHYTLKYKNRIRGDKKGHAIIGFFVDVATGKTLATYQVEKAGFMCPKLKPLWDRSKPKAWGEALVKKIGFVPAGKKRTRPPAGGGKLKLHGVKSKVGWVAGWRLSRWFAWRWQAFKKPIAEGQKLDPWLELRYQAKGEREWRVLSKHRPYLDYHYSLKHRAAWKEARDRELYGDRSSRKYCADPASVLGKCAKMLRHRGLAKSNEYPFTGQVWIFWNKKSDALLAFWDDSQLLGVDTEKAFVVYRSHITVHTLVDRKPSTLIPKAPPPMKPAMKAAVSANKPVAGAEAGAKMSAEKPAASSPKTSAKKKGCGCQAGSKSTPVPLILGLIALLVLRRRPDGMVRFATLGAALMLVVALVGCGDDDSGTNLNNNANTNTAGYCGDGNVDVDLGEACDDGEANSDTAADACRLDCSAARCGDDVNDSGEACDDGNTADGDDCRGDCLQDFTLCGNGNVDPGEACDDGTANSEAPNEACRTNCQARGCGDGVIDDQHGEVCDDGNLASHDGCSSGCTPEVPAWVEVTTSVAPDGREGVAMAYDVRRGRLVLFGGGPEGAYFGETWEFDGQQWYDVSPETSPTPRKFHAMAYDEVRGVVVLYGGMSHSSEYRDDTWEYDGATWVETSPTLSPGARNQHAMTYDASRSVMVLFGGLDPSYLGDTWEYNGDVWLERPTSTAPAPRRSVSMAYDAARDRTVLFGGVVWDNDVWHYSKDTWEWDGSSWMEATPTASPTGLEGHTLAYDPSQERVVLFGGEVTSFYQSDTWLYDGANWALTPLTPSPVARTRHGLAHTQSGLVVYGGYMNDYPFYPEDTWVYRPLSAWPDEQCANGDDDDQDGLADCADPDCNGRACDGGFCVAGACQ